jgi:DNA-binding FrmR family transcriptional regulator
MSVRGSVDSYVLRLCEEFGISDRKGEKKSGIDSRVDSLAQSIDLTVSESQEGKPLKVSVWIKSTTTIWGPIKNFFRSCYNAIFRMKEREDHHVHDLYSKVQKELQSIPQEASSLSTPTTRVQVNTGDYTASLKTLRSVLLKMGALKTVLEPFTTAYTELENRVQEMEQIKDKLQKPSAEDLSQLNKEIEELHKKIVELGAKARQEKDVLPADSQEISAALQNCSIDSLTQRAEKSFAAAKTLLSQAALGPAQKAQEKLAASVQHIEDQRAKLHDTGSVSVEDIRMLHSDILQQIAAIQVAIDTIPKGILLPEQASTLSKESETLLQKAQQASEATRITLARYQQNKRLTAAAEAFFRAITPTQSDVPQPLKGQLEALKSQSLSEDEIHAYEVKMEDITNKCRLFTEMAQKLRTLPTTHPSYNTTKEAIQAFKSALHASFQSHPLKYQEEKEPLEALAEECKRKIEEALISQEESHTEVVAEQRQTEVQAQPSGTAIEGKAQEEEKSEEVELPISTESRLKGPERDRGPSRRKPTRKPFEGRYRPQEEHLVASPPEPETFQPTKESTTAESHRPPPRGLPPGAALAGLAGAAASGRTQLRRAAPRQTGQRQETHTAPQIPFSRLRHIPAQKDPEPVLPFPTPEERLTQPSGKLGLEIQKGPITDRLREFIKEQDLANPRIAFKIALAITKKEIDTNAVLKGIFEDPDIDPFKLLFLADTIIVGLQKPELKDKVVVLLGAALNTPRNAEHLKKIQAYLNRELSKKERTPIASLYGAIMNKLPRV